MNAILTKREKEVMGLLAKGNSSKEIGSQLSTSFKTVNNQIAKVMEKLNVGSRMEAVVILVKNGILK
jgi:DNA-binding NarL/FixJ family response regulator